MTSGEAATASARSGAQPSDRPRPETGHPHRACRWRRDGHQWSSLRRATFEAVTDFRAGGPHGLEAGEWTDDTSMALALADSIAEAGWDLHDQADRCVAWWRTGAYSVNGRVFDIGMATSAALLPCV